MNWSIADILDSVPLAFRIEGRDDALHPKIRSIKIDSRQVEPGDLFVAIKGEHFDAHDFLDQVFAKRALAAVVDRQGWQKAHGRFKNQTFLVVEDTLVALQEMAHAYRHRIAPKVIALTGSNGKTTTKEMAANVLGKKYKVHKTAGNLNNHIGVPLTLLALPDDAEVAVVEMGANHFGEIRRLCEIAAPEVGLITNIGMAHTEFFEDIDGVRRAKSELFAALAENGLACVNLDDPNVVLAAQQTGVVRKLTYGFRAPADIRGEKLELDEDGCARFVCRGKTVRVGVPGLHNAGNALSVLALASHFGVDFDRAIQALDAPIAVSGRMRRRRIAGRTVIDDAYNANPESVRAALDFLAALPAEGARIAVLGDMLELGDDAVAAHAAVLEYGLRQQQITTIFVHGPLFREAVREVSAPAGKVLFVEKKTELAQTLRETTQAGDVFLLKGSRGLRMEEILTEFEKCTAVSEKS